MFNIEIEKIEEKLVAVKRSDKFKIVLAEYNRMLELIGNVEGDEVIALVLVAFIETLK